ncbi:hypothetical protein EXU85_16960 [Spirosoma sp. KCTC 42546]|uniref:hypothetical protein n=1 Tax=Spirosoma sp. KCTC 42546 TaxID=2520506 RepID=UPI001158366A|nr:hypothetical protein [Spirosoma sp. KCTC 42546]QDK80201.1 hypothetical protein EXU85_16960 [Spirosoma sp. KCTC 42546]
MKYSLSLLLVLSVSISCDRNKVDPSVSSCTYAGRTLTRTTQFINHVPATIIAVTSPNTPVISFQISRAGTSAPLSSCNLPVAFAKDRLNVTVSGYLLTFPGMEYMNLSPLPFDVTDVKVRL